MEETIALILLFPYSCSTQVLERMLNRIRREIEDNQACGNSPNRSWNKKKLKSEIFRSYSAFEQYPFDKISNSGGKK
jgi:hypothetical protein